MNVRRRSGRLLITAGMTVIALLCAAPAAQAAFGFQGLSGAPTDLHAGAHSDIQIHVGFSDANQDVKNLTIHLPPGVVGNPTVTPLCTAQQFNADNCLGLAAQLAYYLLLALVPALVCLISLTSFLPPQALDQLMNSVATVRATRLHARGWPLTMISPDNTRERADRGDDGTAQRRLDSHGPSGL